MNQSEEQIISQCKSGHHAAFRTLVLRYQRLVFSVALRMLCDEDAAKDIVQETFIRVWRNIGSYDERQEFRTWIYTIAVRLCLDELKRASSGSRVVCGLSALQSFASDQSPDRQLSNHELAEVIEALADKLGPKQRAVFVLTYLENLTSEEVQSITGMDAGKVKRNLYAAKEHIKQQLKRLGYE